MHEHDTDEVLVFTGDTPTIRETSGRRSISTSRGNGTSLRPPAPCTFPLGFNRVDRPFRFLAIALSGDGHYLPEEKR
ncbi:MAG: hypothetical protein ACTH30_08360 [Leucobacter sp.]